jgi:uroporphyrinogen-III synthase
LAIPQCCISAAVASVVRDAGAMQVMVAASPDENALFEALSRALRP